MFTPIQKRLKDMYDHFQEMVSSRQGITNQEFCDWCEAQDWRDDLGDKLQPINWGDSFRKLPIEFKKYVYGNRSGRDARYFLIKGVELDSSFFVMHLGFEKVIQAALNKKVLKLTFHRVNDPGCQMEVLVQPQHLRKYRGKTYIFGKYADVKGKLLEDRFFHLDINMLDAVSISRRKLFVEKSVFDWEAHFKDIVGIDNFDTRVVEEIYLKVKTNMLNRFLGSELGRFVKSVREAADGEEFADVVLMMKRNKELEREILQYGSDVVVVAPDKLRKDISAHIKELSEIYK